MINFILNNQAISTSEPAGTTVLDFVRYRKNLKGTKIGCREGDCGACTVLVGELVGHKVRYRTMTSCLMPLANAAGRHVVTVEGINPEKRALTPVQQAMVDESGTQCGFCTVGFVMSLTGFCIDNTAMTPQMAVSSIDGNICRCTGYKSIERAAATICDQMTSGGPGATSAHGGLGPAISRRIIPEFFSDIARRLVGLAGSASEAATARSTQGPFVGGGTDLYVQRHEAMADANATHLFYDEELRGVRDMGDHIEVGGSATVTDLLVSPIMQSVFPNLFAHLKLISSTPIRNMATIAGNFINASPIGDMTIWFLALNAEIDLTGAQMSRFQSPPSDVPQRRTIPLRELYLGYKQLAKADDEHITAIRFNKPAAGFRFNFEKISKRTYLDIATVNTAISLDVRSMPGETLQAPTLSDSQIGDGVDARPTILNAHVSVGGVSPIPLYLKRTSEFLSGRTVTRETVHQANDIMQSEIAPISDVRGTEAYKRLVLRQLFYAHFHETLGVDTV